jgi:hypothetical protein
MNARPGGSIAGRAGGSSGNGTFDEAVERQRVALREFMHGNPQPFKDMYSRRDDATLANPFGGVARGWAAIPDRLDRAAS